MDYPAQANDFLNQHSMLLINSYRQLLGKDLIQEETKLDQISQRLFNAPFVLMSHNTDTDPMFNYANLKAIELFEYSWEEFMQLPSRLSAQPVHQAEREKLLAQVNQTGYIDDYQGIRIAKSGKRFLIKHAAVWNLIDLDGNYSGQAACFRDWTYV